MKPAVERLLDRRSFFTSMGKAGRGRVRLRPPHRRRPRGGAAERPAQLDPSQLKITDLRVAVIEKAP
jgi:hypothetical protein